MAITTVCGEIDAAELGVTLAHEHLFIDLRNQFTPFEDAERALLSEQKVAMANLGVLRRNPYALRDNLLLEDVDLAVEELAPFQKLGGRAVVDCTCHGIHRDARKLREVAERTGLHIIAGSGYYTHDTHPAAMDDWPEEKIADEIVRDLTEGIGGTEIRAGIIGEIGTSDPIHPREIKNLKAAARAFREVPAALYVHTYPWGKAGLEAVKVLLRGGVRPEKIVICHTDVEFDLDYIRALLKTGVVIEFDNFGKEFFVDASERGFAGGIFARDIERVRVLRQLVNEGFEKQLLITNDTCLKTMLHYYGGWGYDHILKNIVPMMEGEGIAPEIAQILLEENPRRLLDIAFYR
jgi:phosphotriesterase-related protein